MHALTYCTTVRIVYAHWENEMVVKSDINKYKMKERLVLLLTISVHEHRSLALAPPALAQYICSRNCRHICAARVCVISYVWTHAHISMAAKKKRSNNRNKLRDEQTNADRVRACHCCPFYLFFIFFYIFFIYFRYTIIVGDAVHVPAHI